MAAITDDTTTVQKTYTIEIDVEKKTTLTVTDEMVENEIIDDIKDVIKKTNEYHAVGTDNASYYSYIVTTLSVSSFNDYENEIILPNDEKLVIKYIMSPEHGTFHIFGFLQSLFGTNIAVIIYLTLKYDCNVKSKLEQYNCKAQTHNSNFVFCQGSDYNIFYNLMVNLTSILNWPTDVKDNNIFKDLAEVEKEHIYKRYLLFVDYLKANYDEENSIHNFFNVHEEVKYHTRMQKTELKMTKYFHSLEKLMDEFPDDYIRIVERIKKRYDKEICDLRDKYSPLSRMGPASSSSKRQRED